MGSSSSESMEEMMAKQIGLLNFEESDAPGTGFDCLKSLHRALVESDDRQKQSMDSMEEVVHRTVSERDDVAPIRRVERYTVGKDKREEPRTPDTPKISAPTPTREEMECYTSFMRGPQYESREPWRIGLLNHDSEIFSGDVFNSEHEACAKEEKIRELESCIYRLTSQLDGLNENYSIVSGRLHEAQTEAYLLQRENMELHGANQELATICRNQETKIQELQNQIGFESVERRMDRGCIQDDSKMHFFSQSNLATTAEVSNEVEKEMNRSTATVLHPCSKRAIEKYIQDGSKSQAVKDRKENENEVFLQNHMKPLAGSNGSVDSRKSQQNKAVSSRLTSKVLPREDNVVDAVVDVARATPKSISIRANALTPNSVRKRANSPEDNKNLVTSVRGKMIPAKVKQEQRRLKQDLETPHGMRFDSGDPEADALQWHVFNQGTYKTEICNKWEETGHCPYRDRCQFAHGVEELRPVLRHPRYKTELCRMVAEGSECPYGHRCHFRHSLTAAERVALRK